MSTTDDDEPPTTRKKQRTIKPLPSLLFDVGPADLGKFFCAMEIDPNQKGYISGDEAAPLVESCVAQSIELEGENIDVRTLNVDQLRKLCRNVGAKRTTSSSKFQCRKAIAILKNYEEEQRATSNSPRSSEARNIASTVRMVNVLFGPTFIDRLLSLNDLKNRIDHETRNMTSDFWREAALVYNDTDEGSDDEDDDYIHKIVNLKDDVHVREELEDKDAEVPINLNDFDNLTDDVMRKKTNLLFQVRRKVQENMTVSGTHDSDPYNFLDVAINSIKGAKRMNKIAVHYFFVRCDDHEAIDAAFSPFLDSEIKGSTTDDYMSDLGSSTTVKTGDKQDENKLRMQGYAAMATVASNSTAMVAAMKEANENAKKAKDLEVTIELAKAVGNQEVLNALLQKQLLKLD